MAEHTKKLGMTDETKEIMLIDSVDGGIDELTGLFVIADKGASKALAQKLVRRWNEHDSLKAKADSQPALLEACEDAFKIEEGKAEKVAMDAELGVGEWEACLSPLGYKLQAAIATGKE